MRKNSAGLVGVFTVAALTVCVVGATACKKDDPPAVAPTGSAYPPGAYPPGTYPPGTYPPATAPGPYPTATAPGPYPTATAPAAGGMAVPGPMAFPCTTDAQCGLHHCNTQYQKCAFPCASDMDCLQGSSCVGAGQPVAACLPKMGGQ